MYTLYRGVPKATTINVKYENSMHVIQNILQFGGVLTPKKTKKNQKKPKKPSQFTNFGVATGFFWFFLGFFGFFLVFFGIFWYFWDDILTLNSNTKKNQKIPKKKPKKTKKNQRSPKNQFQISNVGQGLCQKNQKKPKKTRKNQKKPVSNFKFWPKPMPKKTKKNQKKPKKTNANLEI